MFGFKQIDNLLVLVKRMTTFFFLVEAIKIVHSVQNRTHLQYIRTPTLAWMTMGCCVNFSAKSIQCCTHTYNAKTRHCLVVIIYRPKKKRETSGWDRPFVSAKLCWKKISLIVWQQSQFVWQITPVRPASIKIRQQRRSEMRDHNIRSW